jgi:hypothetical protein
MVIAVVAVRVVQMAGYEIVDVIAVGDGGVAAIRTMDVVFGMGATVVLGGAARGIDLRVFQRVFFHMLATHVVQVAIVKVIDMVAMTDGGVATTRTVLMIVIGVNVHGSASCTRSEISC